VEASNIAAIKFYESLGYEEVLRTEGAKLTGDSLFGRTENVDQIYLQRIFLNLRS
jgi:ribosomal protein S18 acetylase RimI-like enzyme